MNNQDAQRKAIHAKAGKNIEGKKGSYPDRSTQCVTCGEKRSAGSGCKKCGYSYNAKVNS